MKRFVLLFVLLFLTLVVARAAQGGVSIRVDSGESAGPTTERAAFFDHRVRPFSTHTWSLYGSGQDAPRRRGDSIVFGYRDGVHRRVFLAGDVVRDSVTVGGAEVLVPLRYDAPTDRWEVSIPLPEGIHRYHFVVEDEDGERRERVDPANPRRRREGERWVSELRIDRHGDVVLEPERRDRRRSRNEHYELDLLAGFGLAYQRVDGLMISARPRFSARVPYAPTVEGFFGYGLSSEQWSVQATFLQPLTRTGSVRAVLTGLDRTDFTDRTGVDDLENSLATLAFREDSRDWFRREGLAFGVELDVFDWALARVEARSDTYESQLRRVRAGWGGREDFLPNPAIDEGVMRSLFARMRLGNDLSHFWVEFEHAADALLSTEYEFTQITAQYRTRMQLGYSQHLDLRLRFGTALDGELPRQKRYLAGGIGTLRGTNYQSVLERGDAEGEFYGGERLLLANAEYVMRSRSDFALACFIDSGNVWLDRDADVFATGWRTSIGLGLMLDGEGHGLRVDVIEPLDGSGRPIVQARLRRPF